MEEATLRKLDEMFSELRQEIKENHLQKVHQQKEQQQHQGHCLSSRSSSNLNIGRRQSLPTHVTSGRRVSMPAKLSPATSSVRRGSLPIEVDVRRASLPTFPARRSSVELPPQHRESPNARRFSRDSLDLDLVIEDASEADADSDYNNSIIVEEDEEVDAEQQQQPLDSAMWIGSEWRLLLVYLSAGVRLHQSASYVQMLWVFYPKGKE
ncbi:hypothetical protein DAPPUDRAFT_258045 [Daphnia pulex]|uniref:Uncharacterized protein n=1 Tax=Daphnia pulex TaxID=6669 RepID=E9HEQ2_DAPPU|nr:hypothetical protein DAPPUDRAFT_258045 [Daphnia pulex]|eukprot:EFX69802.1 hypothetical protein DAPPUDRAFT_258045 [Daphnia pulex]